MSISSHHDTDWGPLALARAATRRIVSRFTGHAYRISVSIPQTSAPAAGFPTLIVLDGIALFATAAETERRLSHRPDATGVYPMVVIGVGHDSDDLYDQAQRHRDFTPGPPAQALAEGDHAYGGAKAFLDFLLEQVLPETAERAPIDRSRLALAGHSLGGLFVLNALVTRPMAFAAYGAISPSVWWNPAGLTDGLTRVSDVSARLFLGVGEREQMEGSGRAERRMVDGAREFAAGATAMGIKVRFSIFAEENHGSVVLPALGRFLAFAGG